MANDVLADAPKYLYSCYLLMLLVRIIKTLTKDDSEIFLLIVCLCIPTNATGNSDNYLLLNFFSEWYGTLNKYMQLVLIKKYG